jgi:hypothetical protein
MLLLILSGLFFGFFFVVVVVVVVVLFVCFVFFCLFGCLLVSHSIVFRIGSITKIFTTLMLSKLVEEGTVQAEDAVSRFYNDQHPPAFRIGML